MTKPIARDPIYRKRAFDADIIELCVRLTRRLRDALQLVDIRVLDHIIVAGSAAASFADSGLL